MSELLVPLLCFLAPSAGTGEDPSKGPKLKDAIVGKWREMKSGATLEFTKDGKVTMHGVLHGTYSTDSRDNVTVTMDQEIPTPGGKNEKKFRSKVEINGDDMKMTDPDSSVFNWKRVTADKPAKDKKP
jgi:hypothetical protein